MEVFADGVARPLVVLHAVTGIVLAGAQGHVAVLSWVRLRGREVMSARMVRHLRTVAVCFTLSFGLGLLAYPHYRFHVRGLVLDREFPWASNLFDLKEHAAALALPLVVATLMVELSGRAPRVAAALALALTGLVAFVIAAGLIVTSARGA